MSLQLGTGRMVAEVAETNEECVKGLAGKTELPETYGLIFSLDGPERWFWMVGMLVPIDSICLDEEWRVVAIVRDVQPEPPEARRGAGYDFPAGIGERIYIEVAAGWCDRYGVQVGMQAEIDP